MVPVGRTAQTEPPSEVQHATVRRVWMLLKKEKEETKKKKKKQQQQQQQRKGTC